MGEIILQHGESHDGRTLYDDLVRAAELYPQRIACIGLETTIGKRTTLTYSELKDKADSFAAGLRSLGVNHGDIVSVQLPNVIEFAIALYGIFKLGAIFNGITSIYREREVEFILNRTESRVYIIPRKFREFDYLAMALSIKARVSTLTHIITVGKERNDDSLESTPFESLFQNDVIEKSADVFDLAQLAFTSGTTGEPKGVMHTHATIRQTVVRYSEHVKPPTTCVNLVVSPVGHQTGFLWGVIWSTYLGGTAVYLDLWTPAAAWQAILSENVTMMIGVSSFLKDLVLSSEEHGSEANSLAMVSIPGAPIPRWIVKKGASTLNCRVVPAWGMTEYGIALAVGVTDPDQAYQTDGRAVSGSEVRVVRADASLAESEEEGDLQIRGEGLFVGYYKRPDLIAENFTDGWFKTGDRARRSEDGYFTLTGRTKDIIMRGGENIPVQDLENVLSEWSLIKDVSIVGMPDERLGERACAFVVPASKEIPTLEKMQEYLNSQRVTKQFWPERLECLDVLPTTASGKIQKYVLRETLRKIVSTY
jgi:cyclohexanecarboxylate-CoA ligase